MAEFSSVTRNIVIFGEDGVGKSTLINSIPNYVSFPSIESAINGTIRQVINEESLDGKTSVASAIPNAYEITCNNLKFNFVDTPGINSAERYRNQDKENLKKITEFLYNVSELHSIFILLKSTTNRLTENFKTIMNLVLRNFHNDALQNIVFCYTHVSDFENLLYFRPREVLKEYFDQAGIDLELTDTNQYYFNNYGYEKLLCKKKDVKATQMLNHYWQNSAAEAIRLLAHVKQSSSYFVEKTMVLNKAENVIGHLVKVVAEGNENLGAGIILKNGFVSMPVKKLQSPQIICKKCVEETSISHSSGVEIKYSIHKSCWTANTSWFRFAISFLWGFNLLSFFMRCPSCPCRAFHHIVSDTEVKVDPEVKVTSLVSERKTILEVCANLSKYIQLHSILYKGPNHSYNGKNKKDIFIQRFCQFTTQYTGGFFLCRWICAFERWMSWRRCFLWRHFCKNDFLVATLDLYERIASQCMFDHDMTLTEIESWVENLCKLPISGDTINCLMKIEEKSGIEFPH